MISIYTIRGSGLPGVCAHSCAPSHGNIGGLLGLDELLVGVGALSTLVGLAEQRGQDLVMVSVLWLDGWAGRICSPAVSTVGLKTAPRAMAEGLTGGRSARLLC
jgi:hypothetical protein